MNQHEIDELRDNVLMFRSKGVLLKKSMEIKEDIDSFIDEIYLAKFNKKEELVQETKHLLDTCHKIIKTILGDQ